MGRTAADESASCRNPDFPNFEYDHYSRTKFAMGVARLDPRDRLDDGMIASPFGKVQFETATPSFRTDYKKEQFWSTNPAARPHLPWNC